MEVKDIEKEVDIIIELTKDLKKNKGKKESEFSNMACFSFYMALFFSVFNLFFMDLNIFTFSLIIVLFFLTNFCLFINNVLMKINYSKDRKAIKEINPKYCDFRDLYLTNIFKKEYDKISKLSDLGLNILKKEFPNTHYQFKEKQII